MPEGYGDLSRILIITHYVSYQEGFVIPDAESEEQEEF